MKSRFWLVGICSLAAFLSLASLGAGAHQSGAKPEVDRLLADAKAAQQKRDYTAAIANYRKAIELDPSNQPTHSAFISAVQAAKYAEAGLDKAKDTAERRTALYGGRAAALPELRSAYEAWAKKFPKTAAIQWALGKINDEDVDTARRFYRTAVGMDPRFARAYFDLGLLAQMQDEREEARKYFKQAADADQSSDYYDYMYVMSLEPLDHATFRAAANDLAARFPKSDNAPRALQSAAAAAESPAERIAVLERICKEFPQSGYGGRDLFSAYLTSDPAKALELARTALAAAQRDYDKKTWTSLALYAQQFVDGHNLLLQGKARAAFQLLENVEVPAGMDSSPLCLLRADAEDKGGETAKAYALLLDEVATHRRSETDAALAHYGAKMGKGSAAIESDIWESRIKSAKPIAEFELPRFDNGVKVRLSSQRGHVVLLNFWFPT